MMQSESASSESDHATFYICLGDSFWSKSRSAACYLPPLVIYNETNWFESVDESIGYTDCVDQG
jgi:hypothetical protein